MSNFKDNKVNVCMSNKSFLSYIIVKIYIIYIFSWNEAWINYSLN